MLDNLILIYKTVAIMVGYGVVIGLATYIMTILTTPHRYR